MSYLIYIYIHTHRVGFIARKSQWAIYGHHPHINLDRRPRRSLANKVGGLLDKKRCQDRGYGTSQVASTKIFYGFLMGDHFFRDFTDLMIVQMNIKMSAPVFCGWTIMGNGNPNMGYRVQYQQTCSLLDSFPSPFQEKRATKRPEKSYTPLQFSCAKRREFSGMIHWLAINNNIPATPSNPSIPCV